jgi:hypothetical protein
MRLAFTSNTKAIVGRVDIYLDAVPCSTNSVDCQFTYTPSQSTSTTFSQEDVCRMITQPTLSLTSTTKDENNLLKSLR